MYHFVGMPIRNLKMALYVILKVVRDKVKKFAQLAASGLRAE